MKGIVLLLLVNICFKVGFSFVITGSRQCTEKWECTSRFLEGSINIYLSDEPTVADVEASCRDLSKVLDCNRWIDEVCRHYPGVDLSWKSIVHSEELFEDFAYFYCNSDPQTVVDVLRGRCGKNKILPRKFIEVIQTCGRPVNITLNNLNYCILDLDPVYTTVWSCIEDQMINYCGALTAGYFLELHYMLFPVIEPLYRELLKDKHGCMRSIGIRRFLYGEELFKKQLEFLEPWLE